MTRGEFIKVILALESIYDNLKVSHNDFAVETWYGVLGHISMAEMDLIIKKHVSQSKFKPTPNDLLSHYIEMRETPQLDASDAWGEVTKAIRYYGVYREIEALESLSEGVRGIVKAMGYNSLCMSENQMADRAHFMKMYEQGNARAQKQLMLSDGLKSQISALAESFGKVEVKRIESTDKVIPDSYEDDCGADGESNEERFKREYSEEYGEDFEE